jgi:low affinity Fe/Cu permease
MTFAQLTEAVSRASGHPWTVIASFGLVLLWAATGPYYGWSDGHQLWINTVTTVVTFWLVFVIQATQNRDTIALQAKLDELIRATDKARNTFIGIDHKEADEVEQIRKETTDADEKPGSAGRDARGRPRKVKARDPEEGR